MARQSKATTKGSKPARIRGMFSDPYKRFIERFRTALRALGLGILTYISKEKPEPPKVLVDRSLRLALARSLVHVLPAAISMFLVAWNLQGWFIGVELQGEQGQDGLKMGILQICAKLQELLIVASLGSIVIHMIRWELAFGSGLPFGLIVSGWKFTDVSYFWSADFLGAVFLPEMMPPQQWRRVGLITIVIVSGLIAVTAGPAAAVLMIPRRIEHPIGGSVFWLSGSDEELWPTTLSADSYSTSHCSPEQTLTDWACPGYGLASLLGHYSTWWNHMYQDMAYDFQLNDGFLRKVMYVHSASIPSRDTWVYTAHAASALLEDAMSSMHRHSIAFLSRHKPSQAPWPRQLANAETQAYELNTKVPAVRTACIPQGRVDFSSGNLTLKFVDIPETEPLGWPVDYDHPEYPLRVPTREIDVDETVRAALSRREILGANYTQLDEETIFANGQRRVVAVPVSMQDFGMASSLGIVLFINHTLAHWNPSFNTVTCSIDARWAKAKSILKSNLPSRLLEHEFIFGRVRNPVMVELESKASNFLHSYGPAEPGIGLTGIRLDPSWYDLFSPVVHGPPFGHPEAVGTVSTNQTALERILDASHSGDRLYVPQIQHTVSSAIADGLSRCGAIPNRQISHYFGPLQWDIWRVENEELARAMVRRGEPEPTHEMPEGLRAGNTTRMVTHAIFTGFTMVANDWFDYFCIVVLLAHAVIALGHTIFVCWRRETGSAWDTILEFVALAHKSPPPNGPVLSNTCAGVTSFKTIGAVAWVEAAGPGEDGGDQLRLRFRGDTDKRAREVEKGAKYNEVKGQLVNDSAGVVP